MAVVGEELVPFDISTRWSYGRVRAQGVIQGPVKLSIASFRRHLYLCRPYHFCRQSNVYINVVSTVFIGQVRSTCASPPRATQPD